MKDHNRYGKKSLFQISKVLWHLDIFRRSFRELTGHTCMVESCIFCALKELFSQLQFSQQISSEPEALRLRFAQSFFDQQRFQLGFMDDAAECFENILVRIHYHLGGSEDVCSAKHCIPHVKFAMSLVEQSVCGVCGTTSEPLPFTQMVHYVSASALVSQAKQMENFSSHNLFGQLLKRAGGMGDIRDCPSLCGAKIQIRRQLTNQPEVVSVGIVWDSEKPSLDQVTSLVDVVGTNLNLSDVFDTPKQSAVSHSLVAIVTYYGKHYSTFFFHTKLRIWIYFDDVTVKEVGPRWQQVVEKWCRGRYQPLLLVYTAEVDGGAPESAYPVQSTIEPRRRSLTPSPEKPSLINQRRALTPNPEHNAHRASLTVSEYQNLSIFGGEKVVRRDSGNWSGDRNSASSSSSTSIDNPYQYIINRIHNRSVGSSPSKIAGGKGVESGGSHCDTGYDSFSLSSTDSLPLQQSLKHNLQLAKIPEGHQSPAGLHFNSSSALEYADCERLCEEADLLLYQSQATDDLKTALTFANAAVAKAKQAMDAPYSNPAAASAARMKHNTCLMQARSIHKKLEDSTGSRHAEGRHSREGSGSSNRGNHSRQNSRDKGNHSRQNSKELLPSAPVPSNSHPPPQPQNIEIYATLPKTRKGLLSRTTNIKNIIEDEEYLMYDRPGRTLNRNKISPGKKEEKRTRSEERSNKKEQKEVISNQLSKDAKKQMVKVDEAKQGKKQHKIRRKLLMGGLIKRKNRSLPDLRDDDVVVKGASKDDSVLAKTDKQQSLSGYLSEGHLEYTGNPNLEKSKLMRKSFYGSRLIQMAKVPPPPPLRTTSQLSKSEVNSFIIQANSDNETWNQEPQSLPVFNHYSDSPGSVVNYAVGGILLDQNCNTKLVTTAQVHQPSSLENNDDDEEFQLPPYPSPLNSVTHSRQASEDFPPPPPEVINSQPHNGSAASSLLEQLQIKRQQIFCDRGTSKDSLKEVLNKKEKGTQNSDSLLKELQAKQATLRDKSFLVDGSDQQNGKIQGQVADNGIEQISSVKDLKSRFEKISVKGIDKPFKILGESSSSKNSQTSFKEQLSLENLNAITPAPISLPLQAKPRELKSNLKSSEIDDLKSPSKKKSVTFCEQVVLVATAEEDKVDSYIPNPILERVLRSVLHKESPQEIREVTVHSVVPLKRNDSGNYGHCGKRNANDSSYGEVITSDNSTAVPHVSEPLVSIQNKTGGFHSWVQNNSMLNRQPLRIQPSPTPVTIPGQLHHSTGIQNSSNPEEQQSTYSGGHHPFYNQTSDQTLQDTNPTSNDSCKLKESNLFPLDSQNPSSEASLYSKSNISDQVQPHITLNHVNSQCHGPRSINPQMCNPTFGNTSVSKLDPSNSNNCLNSSLPNHQSAISSNSLETHNYNAAFINKECSQPVFQRSQPTPFQFQSGSLPYSQQMLQQININNQGSAQHNINQTNMQYPVSQMTQKLIGVPSINYHQNRAAVQNLQTSPSLISLRQRMSSPNLMHGQGHVPNYNLKPMPHNQETLKSQTNQQALEVTSKEEKDRSCDIDSDFMNRASPRSCGNISKMSSDPLSVGPLPSPSLPIKSSSHNFAANSQGFNNHSNNRSPYVQVPQRKVVEDLRRARPPMGDPNETIASLNQGQKLQPDVYQRVPNPHQEFAHHVAHSSANHPYPSSPQQVSANYYSQNTHCVDVSQQIHCHSPQGYQNRSPQVYQSVPQPQSSPSGHHINFKQSLTNYNQTQPSSNQINHSQVYQPPISVSHQQSHSVLPHNGQSVSLYEHQYIGSHQPSQSTMAQPNQALNGYLPIHSQDYHTDPYQLQENHSKISQIPPQSLQRQPIKYPPYQLPPIPKQDQSKSIQCTTSVTRNSCNLCKKKPVNPPSVYCADCHFYVSRFKTK